MVLTLASTWGKTKARDTGSKRRLPQPCAARCGNGRTSARMLGISHRVLRECSARVPLPIEGSGGGCWEGVTLPRGRSPSPFVGRGGGRPQARPATVSFDVSVLFCIPAAIRVHLHPPPNPSPRGEGVGRRMLGGRHLASRAVPLPLCGEGLGVGGTTSAARDGLIRTSQRRRVRRLRLPSRPHNFRGCPRCEIARR